MLGVGTLRDPAPAIVIGADDAPTLGDGTGVAPTAETWVGVTSDPELPEGAGNDPIAEIVTGEVVDPTLGFGLGSDPTPETVVGVANDPEVGVGAGREPVPAIALGAAVAELLSGPGSPVAFTWMESIQSVTIAAGAPLTPKRTVSELAAPKFWALVLIVSVAVTESVG